MIYFIHLKKDIGRFKLIEPLRKKLNGNYWNGEYIVPCDELGNNLQSITPEQGTYAAKIAKIKMFKNFLENSDDDYITVFEDDIICHKDFMKNWAKLNKLMTHNKKWKLIYLGVSSSLRISEPNSLDLINLPLDKIYTGAYGFILKRELIQEVINKASDLLLKYEPFDYTCLGHIQKKYNKNCFITNPQLLIVDVSGSNIRHNRKQEEFIKNMGWNIKNYDIPIKIPYFILTNNNITKLDRFIKQLN